MKQNLQKSRASSSSLPSRAFVLTIKDHAPFIYQVDELHNQEEKRCERNSKVNVVACGLLRSICVSICYEDRVCRG